MKFRSIILLKIFVLNIKLELFVSFYILIFRIFGFIRTHVSMTEFASKLSIRFVSGSYQWKMVRIWHTKKREKNWDKSRWYDLKLETYESNVYFHYFIAMRFGCRFRQYRTIFPNQVCMCVCEMRAYKWICGNLCGSLTRTHLYKNDLTLVC